MDVQDPSVGMSVGAFVKYTNRYRRDKIQADLKALRKPAEEKRKLEKQKLQAALVQKKKLLVQKKMLLDKQEAVKKRRQEAAAAKMENDTSRAGKTTFGHLTPRPPQAQAEDTNTNVQLVTPSQIDADFSFARSAMLSSAANSSAGAAAADGDDNNGDGDTNQSTAPRLRSFQLTVVSTDSPTGDGPDGAGIFDGFKRVYVVARSSEALLDGK